MMLVNGQFAAIAGFGLAALGAVFAHAQANRQNAPDIATKAYQMRIEGKVDEAEQVLKSEVSQRPTNAAAWFELARLEFQKGGTTGTLDAAEKAIERAINAAPDRHDYHRWAAQIAAYSGILESHHNDRPGMIEQFQKAIKAAEKAVSLHPDDHQARMLLVSLYGNNPPDLGGDRSRAEEQVKILESRSPVDGARARCEFSLKDQPEKRLELWNDLAQKLAADPRVHENLALQYAWAGDPEKATIHADKVLQLDATRSQILVDLARACALEKKLEPAEKFARRYLAYNPPGPVALRAWTYMALGQIQRMEGNAEAAAESLKKAKELDPYCWFTMTPPPKELFQAP